MLDIWLADALWNNGWRSWQKAAYVLKALGASSTHCCLTLDSRTWLNISWKSWKHLKTIAIYSSLTTTWSIRYKFKASIWALKGVMFRVRLLRISDLNIPSSHLTCTLALLTRKLTACLSDLISQLSLSLSVSPSLSVSLSLALFFNFKLFM